MRKPLHVMPHLTRHLTRLSSRRASRLDLRHTPNTPRTPGHPNANMTSPTFEPIGESLPQQYMTSPTSHMNGVDGEIYAKMSRLLPALDSADRLKRSATSLRAKAKANSGGDGGSGSGGGGEAVALAQQYEEKANETLRATFNAKYDGLTGEETLAEWLGYPGWTPEIDNEMGGSEAEAARDAWEPRFDFVEPITGEDRRERGVQK